MSLEHFYTKFFFIGGMSVSLCAGLPIKKQTFAEKFDAFAIPAPLEDNINIQHHFVQKLPVVEADSRRIYFGPPWAVYEGKTNWTYQQIRPAPSWEPWGQTIITDPRHDALTIYNDEVMEQRFLEGGLTSLTLFPTDQILIARRLAYRSGCMLHSLGVVLDGKGYLFVGHSDAGKSTMARLLDSDAVVLCDDRNIVREIGGQFQLFGSWSHGDVPDVSPGPAPLHAIFFLEKAEKTALRLASGPFEKLLACLIRPLETRDWWDKSLDMLDRICIGTQCLDLAFNQSGDVMDLIRKI